MIWSAYSKKIELSKFLMGLVLIWGAFIGPDNANIKPIQQLITRHIKRIRKFSA